VLRKIKEERRRKKEERTNGRDKDEGGWWRIQRMAGNERCPEKICLSPC
jgi:hypothetical protein